MNPTLVMTPRYDLKTGWRSQDIYLGQTWFVQMDAADLIPNSVYLLKVQRLWVGNWPDFEDMLPYYWSYFNAGTQTAVTRYMSHLWWSSIDGAPGPYRYRARIELVTNPIIGAFSNELTCTAHDEYPPTP